MAFPLKSVNLKSAWGGGGPFPDSAPKFCKSCNSSGDMVRRPSTNNKEIWSNSQLFSNSRRGSEEWNLNSWNLLFCTRFQDFADFKISASAFLHQISRFRRFQDFCMWLSVFPFWCKRSKMAVTSSEEWNLDSGNLLFCTIFRRIARFQDFCTVILHRLIFPFWCNCQQKSRFPEKQISNHELVAVSVFPFWCKLSKVFWKFTPIQRSKADFGVGRNTDFRFRESRFAEGALESPRKQNSELQISDSQLGGSTSKVEYRFTDFRFRCARSARGQGVYTVLHQFLRFRSFHSN